MQRPDPHHTKALQRRLRQRLRDDFGAAYMAVNEQLLMAEQRPADMTPAAVAALSALLGDRRRFATARQRFFLLKQAALALKTVYIAPEAPAMAARLAHKGLRRALMGAEGPALHAAAWALGSLPVDVPQPDSPAVASPPPPGALPRRSCAQLLDQAQIGSGGAPFWMGRTLILPCRETVRLVAVKMARSDADAACLAREAHWLRHLAGRSDLMPAETHIPALLAAALPSDPANALFRLQELPIPPNGGGPLQGDGVAIAFETTAGYFTYPNDTRPQRRPAPEALPGIMARNAHQMGLLASRGIVHTAPIPLFHNRIQRHRREDGGRYQWYRAGRLDRWLASCAYPNMGVTGLRDFEHIEPHCGSSEKLFRDIGTHFLSFLLVCGSYFRSAAPRRRGQAADGQPVDARDLFDAKLLEHLITTVFKTYYRGFTGQSAAPELGGDIGRLCERMITEMGQDRHMLELLRAVDQREMAADAFRAFLREGGMPAETIARQVQGVADIELTSGPHLGRFNRTISLPELTDAVGVMAALCMEGRHRLDRQRLI